MNTLANSATGSFSPNFVDQSDGLLSTVIWGTDGQGTFGPSVIGNPPLGSWGYTTYGSLIVVSASDTKRIEEIDIEQGTGFEAIVVLLNKGEDLEFEVIDDYGVVSPAIGTICTYSTRYGSTNMLFVGDKSTTARKREGMRTLTFKTFNAITGLH